MTFKGKLVRNTIANYIGYFIRLPVNFFLFPYLISKLGLPASGILFLATSITGYLGILDLGVKPSLVKHVAQYHAKNQKTKINQSVNSALFIFLIVGIVAGAIMFILGRFYINVFNIAPDLIRQAQIVFYIVSASLVISFPLAVIAGSLNGFQRYDLSRTCAIVSALSSALLMFLVLYRGYGLVWLVLTSTTASFAGQALGAYYLRKIAPYIKVNKKFLNRKHLKEIFRFSFSVFILQLASEVIYYSDRIVLAIFLNPAAVAIYEVAYKLSRIVSRLTNLLASAILPASSELSAKKDKERLRKVYIYTTKYSMAFLFAVGLPIVIFTKSIISLWVGSDLLEAVVLTQVIFIILLLVTNHSASNQILIGMDKFRSIMRYQVIVAVLNLGLSIYLVQKIGILGVILGTTIPFALMEFFYVNTSLKNLKVTWKYYLQQVISVTYLPAAITGGFLLLLHSYVIPDRIREIIPILLVGFLIYMVIFYYLGLSLNEKENLINLYKKVASILKARLVNAKK